MRKPRWYHVRMSHRFSSSGGNKRRDGGSKKVKARFAFEAFEKAERGQKKLEAWYIERVTPLRDEEKAA